MRTITGEDIPLWFTETDSKILVHELSDFSLGYGGELTQLLRYLKLELPALKKIADDDGEPLALYHIDISLDEREKMRRNVHLVREATWQDPDDIASAIEILLKAIDNNPNVFSQAGISERYYLDGSFQQDMIDLQKMARWAYEKDIAEVKLVIR